ncbi:MAG TPA: ectoine synthase [Acidimicrobiia bacterium]|nr:ectoine synthase [Acidimicrobiia bacterium]
MLKRRLDQIDGTKRDVRGEGWRSRRLIVAEDGTPYSFHVTVLDRGARLRFEYEDHRETVYCIEGSGTISDLTAGDTMSLEPGGIYSAGIGEPHEIVAITEMTLACVFDPPLKGSEEAD